MSLVEELQLINNAIATIYKVGKSTTINSGGASRSYTSADLPSLYKRRQEIESELAGGSSSVRTVPGW